MGRSSRFPFFPLFFFSEVLVSAAGASAAGASAAGAVFGSSEAILIACKKLKTVGMQ
jgi:hypothetical protein